MQRPYGVAATINYPLILGSTLLSSSPTLAAGDFQVSIDGGTYANLTSLPTYSNGQLIVALTAAEMTGKNITIRLVDQTATKEWEDDAIYIETVGHPLAACPDIGQMFGVRFTVNDASPTVNGFVCSGLAGADDLYNTGLVVWETGALKGTPPRPVSDWVFSSLTLSLSPALPAAPANGDRGIILGSY